MPRPRGYRLRQDCEAAARCVVLAALGLAVALLAGCPERPADSLPQETPPAGDAGIAAPPAQETDASGDYELVVKRPHVTLALAEARGIDRERARHGVEGLADAFEVCLRRRAAEHKRDDGAARLIVVVDDQGNVSGVNLKVADDASGPAALLCFVANAKAQNFGRPIRGEGDQGRAPGLALEALWKSGGTEKFTP